MSNSQPSQQRKIPQEELKKILEIHHRWVSTSHQEGQSADLSEADLAGTSLANVDLRGANLSRTNFTKGHLPEAKFYEANLKEADLSHADLIHAQFQEANLVQTNVSNANLRTANFQKATLTDANLQGADLSQANLREATLLRTVLKDANLQDADLTDSQGLHAGQLAGANVSGAKLPEEIEEFDGLAQVEELSKSAKKLFISMLLGCVYSWLTIFSTKDAQLLTNSASTPLPIIQTPIPIAGFFGVGPFILLALFTYLHLYLERLWKELAGLPAVFPDGKPLDEKAYPWLLNSLLRAHVSRLRADRPPLSRLEVGLSILLAWWVVPFTVGLFWLRSLQRHDPVLTGFLIAFVLYAVVSAAWFQGLAKRALRGLQQPPIRFTANWTSLKPYKEFVARSFTVSVTGVSVILLGFPISYGAINGIRWGLLEQSQENLSIQSVSAQIRELVPKVLPYVGARAFADLTEQDVSTKPPNWFLRGDEELTRIVDGAQLKEADLRFASAERAFLVKADLRAVQLQRANLFQAQLQGADLSAAQLQEADLREAQLQKAHLFAANLREAHLGGAQLQDADLRATELPKADLGEAELRDADLFAANLQEANLVKAKLQFARLREARLQNAKLFRAQLPNAVLRDAHMQNADLREANLVEAELQKADLRGAQLQGALLFGANLTDAINLTQAQIDEACVDEKTKLPSHLKKPPPCPLKE